MVIFPNCKINLGLNIVRKRSDGYHDLETVFYPLKLQDAIEVTENFSQLSINHIQFSNSGIPVADEVENNLCIKAYNLLKKDFPQLPTVLMHLHKTIPIGAGLGGGSADGGFTLQLINKKFNLRLSEKQLLQYALQLGSDCPFFILNKACFATGRGEAMELVQLDLSAYKLFIVYPGISVSTQMAFGNIHPAMPSKSIKEIITHPISEWKEELINDFEKPVFARHPIIKTLKEKLYDAGAVFASMSGSGSAVYGIFEKGKKISLTFPENYFAKEINA
jgi:4-diphosphocytidyl-2-C-methyl-D-erythritol kinase